MVESVKFSLQHLGQSPDQILENLQESAPPAETTEGQ